MPRPYALRSLGLSLVLAFLSSCSGEGQRTLASAVPPGEAVVSYPNSADQDWTTVLFSKPDTTQAGIDGRVATIRVFNREQPYADELTLDIDGNLGLRGNVFTRSSRKEKKDISAYRGDALALIAAVHFVSYLYKNERDASPRHIGLIAEEAPRAFTGPHRASFNLNNSIAINMAATQELDAQVRSLRGEITRLRRELRTFKRKQ